MNTIQSNDIKPFIQCRLCAEFRVQNELIHVKEAFATNLNLEYKIFRCLQLQILETDILPHTVCLTCCDKVGTSYEFSVQVEKAQETLRSSLVENEYKKDVSVTNDDIKLEPDESFAEYPDCIISDDVDKKEDNESDEDNEDNLPLAKRACKEEDEYTYKKEPKRNIQYKKERIRKVRGNQEKRKLRNERTARLRKLFTEFDDYKWRCGECQVVPENINELQEHYKTVHDKLPQYLCNECDRQFEAFEYFKRHARTHKNQEKFCCETCGRYFHLRAHLDRHQEVHSKERKFICAECGKGFKTSGSLRSHNRAHLPSEIKYQYECELCNKKFSSKPNLICHKKLHTGAKEYTCHECGKGFMQKGNLDQHLKTIHSDYTPFKCEKCSKMFKTKSSLKTHLKIHSEVKPHACEVCGKRFRRKGTLTRHESVHSDVLPFECEYCKKCFRMKTFLKIHLRQHTGERPYSCLDCNHHFTDSSNYIKHMKGRHGIHSIAKIPVYSKKILQGLNQPS